MKDAFKKKVHDCAELIRNMGDEKNPMLLAIMPLLNRMGLAPLERIAEDKPEEVYMWLMVAKSHIDEAIALYDADNT